MKINFNNKLLFIVAMSNLIAGVVQIYAANEQITVLRDSYNGLQDKSAATMMIVIAMRNAVKIKSGSTSRTLRALRDNIKNNNYGILNPQYLFRNNPKNFNDNKIMQCMIDTLELENYSQKLMDAKADYESAGLDAIFDEQYDMDFLDSGLITIDVPEDSKKKFLEACTEAGLISIDMDDSYYSCSIGGKTLILEMNNQASCLAPTEECNFLDLEQFSIDTIALFGIECTSESSTGSDLIFNSTIGSVPTKDNDEESDKSETPIIMNVDALQCGIDTLKMKQSSQELMDAQAAYDAAGQDAIGSYDPDSGLVTVDVPEDVKRNYIEACREGGLNALDMDDSYYSCSLIGLYFDIEMKNQASCVAPTDECNTIDIDQITIDTFALFGMNCISKTSESPYVFLSSQSDHPTYEAPIIPMVIGIICGLVILILILIICWKQYNKMFTVE